MVAPRKYPVELRERAYSLRWVYTDPEMKPPPCTANNTLPSGAPFGIAHMAGPPPASASR